MSWQALIRLFGIPVFLTILPTAIVLTLYTLSVFGDHSEIRVADLLYVFLRWPLGAIYLLAFGWAGFNIWRLRRGK